MSSMLARVGLLLAVVTTPLLAQQLERDLWIGVLLIERATEEGRATPTLGLTPVAALIGDRWVGDLEGRAEWHALPSGDAWRWEPAARPLPRRWVAWLPGARRIQFSYEGPPRVIDWLEMRGVGTGIAVDEQADGQVKGVAVSGRVDVRPFTDVDGPAHDVVPEPLRRAFLAAERRGLRSKPEGFSEDWYKVARDFPPDRLPTLSYHVTVHRVATRGNGSRTVVYSHFKSVAQVEGCSVLISEGALDIAPDGRVSVLYAGASLSCNELSTTYRPIAILERAGKVCWLAENQYEDGSRYTLTRPGEPGETDPPDCAIR